MGQRRLKEANRTPMNTIKRNYQILIGLILLTEVIAIFVHYKSVLFSNSNLATNSYRIVHLLQMVILLATAIRAGVLKHRKILYFPLEGEGGIQWNRIYIMLVSALGLSFVGDIINSRLVDLTSIFPVQTLLSAPFFIAAHILYIWCFVSLNPPETGGDKSFRRNLVAAIPVTGILLWALLIPVSAPALVFYVSMIYALVVCAMALLSLLFLKSWGRAGRRVALGGLLFLFSDALIGAWLLEPAKPFMVGVLIWVTYIGGQMLIFSSLFLYEVRGSARPAATDADGGTTTGGNTQVEEAVNP